MGNLLLQFLLNKLLSKGVVTLKELQAELGASVARRAIPILLKLNRYGYVRCSPTACFATPKLFEELVMGSATRSREAEEAPREPRPRYHTIRSWEVIEERLGEERPRRVKRVGLRSLARAFVSALRALRSG